MATVKIVLRKKKQKDGTYPLALRITKDRKTSFIHLGKNLFEKDWDATAHRVKKSHPNSTRLNNFLLTKLAEANNSSLELETAKPTVSAITVKRKIKPQAGETVFTVADMFVNQLKEDGKFKQWTSQKSNVKHLKAFLKTDIPFSDLTIPVLERFKAYVKAEYKVSERTAVNHWVMARSLFSFAIKMGACDEKYYPFGKGRLKIKFPDTKKIGLNTDEVARIESAELPREGNHARNLWLISYYFAGMRISDVLRLRWSDFQDGRLHYTMGKNNKTDSLKASAKVIAILKQYEETRDEENDLIFAELRSADFSDRFEADRLIASRVNMIDKYLRTYVAPAAKITKPLTMHIARHTFGNISGDRIPVQMLQKLYRHTDIKTTIGYQANFIHKDVDEALAAVIGS
jgi:integrase/recombinase XerD